MENHSFHIYKDIQQRTNGAVYLGVVGPVRTGKSTFIKRFMDVLVLPNLNEPHIRQQINDELPQSGNGKTIMTTEPKFIPMNPAEVMLEDGSFLKLRLIDCVGYMTEGALGHMEDNAQRMVKTPWSTVEIPFSEAASIGTRKVIEDHSTIGIVVTTDGSFGDLPRENYLVPEEQTIRELQAIGKPFVVLLNSAYPAAAETKELARQMEEQYHATVIPVNCLTLNAEDITHIMERMVTSFPANIIYFTLPKWVELLPADNEIRQGVIQSVQEYLSRITSMKDVVEERNTISGEYINRFDIRELHRENGEVSIVIQIKDNYYYGMLSNLTGMNISNEADFLDAIKTMAAHRKECENLGSAWGEVKEAGYGVVYPQAEQIRISDPELVKHGGKFGVKLKATAPSTQLIRADIEIEIAPIVGTLEQANDLIAYMKQQVEEGNDGIFETNIFGKTVRQLIEDGIEEKIGNISRESREKLQHTMQKIVNESNRGIICIII
ncbi:MAG: stage IV sporulation protein A [Lachnospiraceae bacterium]|nr:stage IV sporulation protein A [Lachnospiraceae bacterium]